ncbi:uncharacterized protein TNCV_326971 [Trichonephila clavipes]|nr:uncharacterized protein TNCV_326971 [Trichonephila clavipes]
MITNFFIPELNNHDVQELWFQQDGATCHTARATIDLLKDTFGDRLISRFGPVNWPPRSCDLTPLDYFLWSYAERDAAHRAAETPERSQARRRRQAEYLASQRAAETPEQSQARRLQHATYMASQRDTETIEATESRKRAVAERAQQRRLIFTKNTGGYSIKLHSSIRNWNNVTGSFDAEMLNNKNCGLNSSRCRGVVVWTGGASTGVDLII